MKTYTLNKGTECVLVSSVPEAEEFEKWLFGSAAPMPNGETGWAHMGDYVRFLARKEITPNKETILVDNTLTPNK